MLILYSFEFIITNIHIITNFVIHLFHCSPLPVEEELGMQNYGYTNEVYDPSQSADKGLVFHTTGAGDKPYSYLYNGHTDPALRKTSFGSSIAQEPVVQKQADRHKQNSAFWGNLNDSSDQNGSSRTGTTDLQPILTSIDTSQGVGDF